MGTSLGLNIIVRVPVAIEDNHSVRGREIQSQAAGLGGQKHDKALQHGVSESSHCFIAFVRTSVAV
jgi:hypothetical protein